MFFSLLSGLLMAFAFQLLLTNLGVALGLSALGWAISPTSAVSDGVSKNAANDVERSNGDRTDNQTEESSRSAIPPVSHLLGLGVTLTLASVLFATAFLSATFSEIDRFSTGLVFGLILWAAYLLVLIWISSITVSGILDFVLGTATAGIRRLFGTVEQIFSTNDSDGNSSQGASKDELQETIEGLSTAINQTLSGQKQLPALLAQQRETLLEEICDRTNLTQDQAESVLDRIQPDEEDTNKTSVNTDDVEADVSVNAFDSERQSLGSVFQGNVAEMLPNWRDLLRSAVARIDTSELDLETAWNTFQNFVGDGEAAPFNIIELDAENYVKEAPVYSLESERLSEEFSDRIYDPEADPTAVESQLQSLKLSDFSHWLEARGDLSTETIDNLAGRLKAVQEEILEKVREKVEHSPDDSALAIESEDSLDVHSEEIVDAPLEETSEKGRTAEREAIAELNTKLISYFRYTSLSKLTAQSVEEKLQSQIEEISAEKGNSLRNGGELDFDAIAQTISNRKSITKTQKQELTDALKSAWQSYQPESPKTALSSKVTGYLQTIDWSEANLEDFKDEVLQQVKNTIASGSDLSSSIDPSRLVESLSVPGSVKTDLIELIKREGKPLLKRPRRWVERAARGSQDWGQQLTYQIGEYLQHQDFSSKPEQAFEGIGKLLKQTAQSIPTENLLDLGADLGSDFWQQMIEHREDINPEETKAFVGKLSDVWQSATRSLPQEREQLKEQGIEQWQDVRLATRALSHLVGDDIVEPVLEAIPELDDLLDPAKEKFIEALEIAQVGWQQQTALVAQELQEKAEGVRHQVAIAAWWLFISLFASGASAAAGGWLAVWASLRMA